MQETVTLPGTTVVQTVTTAPEPTAGDRRRPRSRPPTDPSELNDQGFELMQAGRYEEALPLLEQAVAGLPGSGELAEAYASYNLAFTRRALGRCDGVRRAARPLGSRFRASAKEISRLRQRGREGCCDEEG